MRKFIAVGFLFYISALLISVTAQISSIPSSTGSVSQAYETVQDEGTPLTQRNTLNFTGAGVTCTDDAGNSTTDCDIPGGPNGLFQTVINDFRPTITSTSVLTIAGGYCWGLTKATSTATISGGSGNGSYVVYCTDTQTIVVSHSTSAGLTVSCSNCQQVQETTPTVPEGMYAIASGTITTGTWAAVTDLRSFTTRFRFQNGSGMNVVVNGSVVTLQVDGAAVQLTANDYDILTRLDATASESSAPAKTGTSLPGTCTVGDQYFKSDASAGSNIYGCTSSNTWTAQGSGSGSQKVVYNLPFGAYEATGGATSRFWDLNVAYTFGRTAVDGVCPTDATIQTCSGMRWPSIVDSGVQTYATTNFWIPDGWTSGTATLRVAVGTSSGSFTPSFEVKTACQVSGSGLPTYNSAQTLTGAITNNTVTIMSLALDTTGCAANRPMIVQLSRTDGTTNQNVALSSASVSIQVP